MRIDCQQAKELLLRDEVVAVPTETVYGLAASLHSEKAIEKIFELKSRPKENPLIVHISQKEQISQICGGLPPFFEELARAFWPGPLTLVAPAAMSVPSIARAGLPTAAVRMPDHPLTLKLIDAIGPIVAPSANLSGLPSSTTPDHVEQDFGKEFPILEGGTCTKGIESTILIFDGSVWRIGRQGSIPLEEFSRILPYHLCFDKRKNSSCPGQMFKHYSPRAKLTLSQESYSGTPETVVGFEGRHYPNARQVLILGEIEKPETVMANLYNILRQLDNAGIEEAWIDADFPRKGLLATIAERLEKASART